MAGIGLALGVIGSVLALAFLGVQGALLDVIWPDDISTDAFSGSPIFLVIMGTAGLIVGLMRRFIPNAEEANTNSPPVLAAATTSFLPVRGVVMQEQPQE
jgi:hypothetical protein